MQVEIVNMFKQAMQLLQSGDIKLADNYLKKIIKLNPEHSDALYWSGMCSAQTGNYLLAIHLIKQAVYISPANEIFHCNLGLVYKKINQLEKAIESYTKSIQLKPDFFQALCNRGVAFAEISQWDLAVADYLNAIKINPTYENAYFNLGNAFQQNLKPDEAIECFEKAIQINPANAENYLNCGNVYEEKKQFEKALIYYEKAIAIQGNYYQAYSSKAKALFETHRLAEAIECCNKAIQLNPQYAEAYLNQGNIYKETMQWTEAIDYYKKAISLKPNYALAFYNLGLVNFELNKIKEAKAAYDKAIEIDESYVEAHWNKGLALLGEKEFEAGWPLYAWRWKREETHSNFMSLPKPLVEDLNKVSDKNILVWAEQGVGDQVMYAGLLPELFDISPHTQVLIDGRLIPLLSRAMPQAHFIDKNTAVNALAYEMHMPMGDLGKHFRKSAVDFEKTKAAYLIADKKRAEILRNQLLKGKQLLCGITWHSGRDTTGLNKSMQLGDLLPVLKLAGISFVSLQYGDMSEELAEFNRQTGAEIQACESVDNFKDLDGHAALIEACDFVVTISNTSAHIAGAIGKDTYLLYPKGKGALWYWANQINHKSMWYPNVQIYQQHNNAHWSDAVQQVKTSIVHQYNIIDRM